MTTLNRPLSSLVLCLLAATACHAADTPPIRAPGLWAMDGGQGQVAGRMCVGPNEDLARQRRPDGVAQCDTARWQQVAADRWQMQMVCRMAGTVATHRSEVSGNPASALRLRMSTHYEPARGGQADEQYEMSFNRVGDCPPGVKPGSMVLPNGMVLDPRQALSGGPMPRP